MERNEPTPDQVSEGYAPEEKAFLCPECGEEYDMKDMDEDSGYCKGCAKYYKEIDNGSL